MDGLTTSSRVPSTPRKHGVRLTGEQRERLERLTRNGSDKAKRILHARVLLMSDEDHPLGRYADVAIAHALGLHANTVARVRRRFVEGGGNGGADGDAVAAAVDRKSRLTPPTPPKLDGAAEAHLIAICCSPAPAGRVCWTMSLLAKELVGRKIVTSISREAVRLCLKKTSCSPGGPSGSASRNGQAPRSSRGWRRCSTSTRPRTTPPSR